MLTRSTTIRRAGLALALCCSLGWAQAQQSTAPAAAAQTAAAPAAAPAAAAAAAEEGKIAYYGHKFAGRKTASGQRFNPDAMTMAHNTLAFGTRVRVTNLANKRSAVLRVNDRGPSTPGRVGDVSRAAAQKLRMTRAGVVDARLEVLGR